MAIICIREGTKGILEDVKGGGEGAGGRRCCYRGLEWAAHGEVHWARGEKPQQMVEGGPLGYSNINKARRCG